MREHMDECPNRPRECPFKTHGCSFKVSALACPVFIYVYIQVDMKTSQGLSNKYLGVNETSVK